MQSCDMRGKSSIELKLSKGMVTRLEMSKTNPSRSGLLLCECLQVGYKKDCGFFLLRFTVSYAKHRFVR